MDRYRPKRRERENARDVIQSSDADWERIWSCKISTTARQTLKEISQAWNYETVNFDPERITTVTNTANSAFRRVNSPYRLRCIMGDNKRTCSVRLMIHPETWEELHPSEAALWQREKCREEWKQQRELWQESEMIVRVPHASCPGIDSLSDLNPRGLSLGKPVPAGITGRTIKGYYKDPLTPCASTILPSFFKVRWFTEHEVLATVSPACLLDLAD